MKKQHVRLTEKDRKTIKELLSKGTLKVRKQKRIRGIQMLDEGLSFQEVSKRLKVSHISLSTWAKNYEQIGLKCLDEQPRSGRPPGLSGADRAKVTALACSEPPEGRSQWSLRLLADKLVELEYVEKISHTKVADILKKTNSSPI